MKSLKTLHFLNGSVLNFFILFKMHLKYVYFTFKCLGKIDIISNRHLNDI